MTRKLGRDLRPNDLLVLGDKAPQRIAEVRWTTGGLHYTTTVNAAAFPLDPDRPYEVAHPLPPASADWSVPDQAWVINVSTEGIPDEQSRVLVNLDGVLINATDSRVVAACAESLLDVHESGGINLFEAPAWLDLVRMVHPGFGED